MMNHTFTDRFEALSAAAAGAAPSPAQFSERMKNVIADLREHYSHPAHVEHAVEVVVRANGPGTLRADLGL